MLVSRRGDPRFEWGREKRGEGKVMVRIRHRRRDDLRNYVEASGVIAISHLTTRANLEDSVEILIEEGHFGIESPSEIWHLRQGHKFRKCGWGIALCCGGDVPVQLENDRDVGLAYRLPMERKSHDYLLYIRDVEEYQVELSSSDDGGDRSDQDDVESVAEHESSEEGDASENGEGEEDSD